MRLTKVFLISAFLFAAGINCCAQVSFGASADRTELDISEDIILTLTLNSASAQPVEIQMPSLPNFNIYSSGESRNIAMSGGRVKAIRNFYYTLSPRFPGKSVIGSFSVEVDGAQYKTEPIEVNVTRKGGGNAGASLAKSVTPKQAAPKKKEKEPAAPKQEPQKNINKKPDFFMTAEVSKKEAWLNEQIDLKIRFYQAETTVGNPQYTRPRMEGLIFEDIKSTQDYEMIDNRKFLFTEFRSALFGFIPGGAVIDSARVDFIASNILTNTFDLFFGGAGNAQRVETEPIKINIRPLPQEGRPASFYGAVGADYNIKAEVDDKNPSAGEPVTLTVTVSGHGNMRAITDIPAPDMGASFRVYETSSSISSKVSGTVVSGNKVFKTVLVPRASGNFVIPRTYFSYFDTASSAFRTLYAEAIELNVAPALNPQEKSAVSFAQEGRAGAKIEKINEDIGYIKEIRALPFYSVALIYMAGLGAYNYIPLVLILTAVAALLIERSGINIFGVKNHYRIAKAGLAQAKTMADISQILTAYIEGKLGRPLGIAPFGEAVKKLNIRENTRKRLEEIWQSFEMLKYAPSSALKNDIAVNEAAQKTLNLIKEIEKELK